MFEIIIDTGGTFTDGVLIDEEQRIGVGNLKLTLQARQKA